MEPFTQDPPQPVQNKSGNFALLALVLVIAAVSFFAGRLSVGGDSAPETQTVWRTTRYTSTYTSTEDVSVYSTVYEYDAQGRLLRSRTEDGDHIYENTYDEDENPMEAFRYDAADGELLYREAWIYDENGNCLSYTEYDAAGATISRSEYTYDEKGRETSSGYGADGAPCKVTDTFEYTDAPDGGYTCVHRYSDDTDPSADVTTTTVYDASGNVLRSESEYARGETYVTESEYTAFEMPIEQIIKEDTP